MRKALLLAAALTVAASMQHSAFACELKREANRQGSVVVADCSGSGCMFNPPKDLLASLTDERTPPDPAQDCGAANFDPGTYSGTSGLIDWLMATLGPENRLGGRCRSIKPVNSRLAFHIRLPDHPKHLKSPSDTALASSLDSRFSMFIQFSPYVHRDNTSICQRVGFERCNTALNLILVSRFL